MREKEREKTVENKKRRKAAVVELGERNNKTNDDGVCGYLDRVT